jgi:hypothetical protein
VSARSRAVPWFGTRGERAPRPVLPPGLDETTLIEAEWLRDAADIETRAQEAFINATMRLLGRKDESDRWHDEIASA